VLLVIAHGDVEHLSHLKITPGDLMLIVAMMVWTTYCIILKRANLQLEGWPQLTAIVAMAVIIMAPFCIADVTIAGHALPDDLKTWGAVAYVGSFASVGALYCWNEGMKLAGAGTSSFFYHLMPVFGTIWSILLLGEEPHLYHAFGFALILGGVYLATAFRRAA